MQGKLLPEQCIACGRCQIVAPNLLDYYDNGLVKFCQHEKTMQTLTAEEMVEFKKAVRICPTRALEMEQ